MKNKHENFKAYVMREFQITEEQFDKIDELIIQDFWKDIETKCNIENKLKQILEIKEAQTNARWKC